MSFAVDGLYSEEYPLEEKRYDVMQIVGVGCGPTNEYLLLLLVNLWVLWVSISR